MGRIQLRKRWQSRSGQSLLETALILPLILLLVLNAINFGYFFIVALHLASAPREGVEYSIQGNLSPSTPSLPPAGPATTNSTVSYLTYQDMASLSGSGASSTTTTVRVCSMSILVGGSGVTNAGTANQTANCTTFPSGSTATFTGPDSDPESPLFVLQRVDVQYTVTPLISTMSLKVGGIDLGLLTPSLTFHRQVSMRAIGY
jgi:Flp pilus assembly protein TadG